MSEQPKVTMAAGIPDVVVRIKVDGSGKNPVRGVDYWTDEDKREMRSFFAGALIAEASGELVTVYPDAESPIGLKVNLVSIQSGTPSADNICSISGRSEVRISRYGVNLFDSGFEYGSLDSKTGAETGGTNVVRSGFVPVVAGIPYLFFRTVVTGTMAIRGYDADRNYIGTGSTALALIEGTNAGNPMKVGLEKAKVRFRDGVRYIRVVDFSADPETKYQMELGDAFTPYQPAQREDWDFPFGQTVFGGELDANRGVLTVTHGEIASYNGETLPGAWISDRDVYAEGAVPTVGAQVVYALAEPYEVNVNAVDPTALPGVNTFYAEGWPLAVNYHQSLTRAVEEIYAYINNKIAATL